MTDKTGYLLHLPWPPSINDYYGMRCNGRVPHQYIKEKGKQYRVSVLEIVQKKDLELRANVPLEIWITWTPPNKGTHDIDGPLKCLFDSITEASFWQDDSYIRKMHIEYATPSKAGSVLLYVEAL